MVLTLKKIQHKGAERIGICFPYSFEVNQKVKSLGVVYSSSLRCWYLDYNTANYHLLQKNFDNLIIENPKPEYAKTAPVAGPESRDLPPIVTSASVNEKPDKEVTKFPEKAIENVLKEHKAEIPLAHKLRLQLHETIGKYWVFSLNYHFAVSKELLTVKGIYWNKAQKVYMAMRNPMVKEKADSISKKSFSEAKIIIAGDFNCTPDDHEIRKLVDQAGSEVSLKDLSEYPAEKGNGTYRYMGTWEMIDQVIVSQSLLSVKKGLFTTNSMLRIFRPDFLLRNDPKYPGLSPFSTYRGYRYQGGFSDHLPVLLDLGFR